MFDTLKYAKILIRSGFSKEQAETSVEVMKEVMDDKLATKADHRVLRKDFDIFRTEMRAEFEAFRLEMRTEFEAFRAEMQNEMSQFRQEIRSELILMETRLTLKLGGMMIFGFATFAAIFKAL